MTPSYSILLALAFLSRCGMSHAFTNELNFHTRAEQQASLLEDVFKRQLHNIINSTMVTSVFTLKLQEVKINWEDAPPVQPDPGNKEEMGDLFTDRLLEDESKL